MAKRKKKKSKASDNQADDLFADVEGGEGGGVAGETRVPLHEATRKRYLNYALSVITSRALPDVRDGLKPVQRRILYTMGQQGITADAKHRKCAKVVGDVMGNYHPHGDMAIYDALVRQAQAFSLRYPLVDGSGNFGSLDGDSAAAMRYTECRLQRISDEMLGELKQATVHMRDNYDGTTQEPVVLPARLPNLLLNGSTGIAVGMATNIPPHHLGEVITSLLKLLENFERQTHHLCCTKGTIQGPDFPTGGQILNTKEELREIYKTGSGAIRMRATTKKVKGNRSVDRLHITSIPYGVNKATLIEQIAEIAEDRKLPPLLDVRDLSTDDVCIELDLKKKANEEKVLAYLFKNTSMQNNFNVNLTCLVPTENPEVGRPQRCDLREVLQHFLKFRLEVVTRRLEHELGQLERRIHVLDGFAFAFDVLDEIIKIIRGSEGKSDAAEKILKKYGTEKKGKGGLDEEQTDAILELKLYRLAKLEVNVVLEELKEKKKRAKEIRALLDEPTEDDEGNPLTDAGRWGIVRSEIEAIRDTYADPDENPRRTLIETVEDEPEFSEEDFIV
ncbi:MAG: DNA gyrase subunit A, partial [Phycisphaeraceae bacterium]|nr:DNA gyrase subunit A [Phycisphaeraceae bacterium]